MANRIQLHACLVLGCFVVAVAIVTLASQYRPDGVLGWLQESLEFLFVLPYLFGIVLGGTQHSPNTVGVYLGAFVEVYIVALVSLRIARFILGSQRLR